MQLKQGTLLQGGKYRIERVLGQGGFGITYLAIQTGLDRKVAVKEFFMKELCNRDETTSRVSIGSEGSRDMVKRFREKFTKEARNIAKLKHPNIVSVIDVFEENDTAYYVMEYCEGGSLSLLLNDKYPQGMPEAKALKYIREVASALDYIHKRNINHLDIKPSNIMLGGMDEAVLIDFGMAKQYDSTTGNQTSTTPVGISHGYAPMEQYRQGGVGQFSPSTDIYSLGATLYKLITGRTPFDASTVNEEGLPSFHASASVKAAILAAMQPRRVDRPQSITEWLGGLDDEATVCQTNVKTEQRAPASGIPAESDKPKDKNTTNSTPETDNIQSPSLFKKLWPYIWKIALCYLVISIGVLIFLFVDSLHEVPTIDETYYEEQSFEGSVSGSINGHDYVDLGLPSGLKWATCNVGASSPEEYGDYFAWGETTPKTIYEWDNCFDCVDADGVFLENDAWEIYNVGGKTRITPDSGHDTARENWGSTWRMPTDEENEELSQNCTWTRISVNGNGGYKVTGPNGNSIFLPSAGRIEGTDTLDANFSCTYISSDLCPTMSNSFCGLYTTYSDHGTDNGNDRSGGHVIRPVSE